MTDIARDKPPSWAGIGTTARADALIRLNRVDDSLCVPSRHTEFVRPCRADQLGHPDAGGPGGAHGQEAAKAGLRLPVSGSLVCCPSNHFCRPRRCCSRVEQCGGRTALTEV